LFEQHSLLLEHCPFHGTQDAIGASVVGTGIGAGVTGAGVVGTGIGAGVTGARVVGAGTGAGVVGSGPLDGHENS